MHESLDEFQFRLDTTTDSRVICHWVSEKSMYNVVNTLAPSFLIGSSLILKVRRTTIISRTCLNFSQIRPRTAELAALERLKKILWTYNGENLVSTLAALLAHLSRRLKGELIVYRSIRRPCVRKHFQTRISQQPVGQS